MTTTTTQAPPCPTCCRRHDIGNDGTFERIGTTIVVGDVPDLEVTPILWGRIDYPARHRHP